MNEDKTVATVKENSKKKKKNQYSLAWIIGIVILILISLTFVLPTTLFSTTQSAISFGKYDGNSIELTNTSYFYYQLQSIYSYYVQYYGESVASSYMYNIYYSAFQQALVNEAFQKLATDAGFSATNKQISDAVVSSGYYSDGTNSYSQEIYNQSTDLQKEQIIAWMKQYVVFNEVQNTITSAPVSSAENSFISSLSSDKRTIEYLAVNESVYPDEDAVSYAKERADLFNVISFTSATFASEDEAKVALEAINAGTKTMEETVSESSTTETKEENYFKYKADDTLSELYSAEEGAFVGPISTSNGYTIYRIDSAAKEPDYTDETVLSAIKSYIKSNDSDTIKAYLDSVIDTIYSEASEDFDAAAEKYGLSVSSVSDVALNTGDSQFIYSYSYTTENSTYSGSSTNGYIYTQAENDSSWNEKLFSVDFGTVLEPVYVNDAYIIVRPVESTGTTNYMSSVISSMYSSYAQQYGLADAEAKIISSDKVEDNFFSAFIQAAYGTSTDDHDHD